MSTFELVGKIGALITFFIATGMIFSQARNKTKTYKESFNPITERQMLSLMFFVSFIMIYRFLKDGDDWNYYFLILYALMAVIISFKITELKHIICPHCLKNIKTDRSWKCPYCGENNKDKYTNIFHKCGECKELLNKYQCPDCKQVIDFNTPYNLNELRAKRDV